MESVTGIRAVANDFQRCFKLKYLVPPQTILIRSFNEGLAVVDDREGRYGTGISILGDNEVFGGNSLLLVRSSKASSDHVP